VKLTISQGSFEELHARRLGKGLEITCIACDGIDDRDLVRIAIGTRDRRVQVWTFDTSAQLAPLFSVQLDVTVPKSVCFTENTARDVYIFGLYDGNMFVPAVLAPSPPLTRRILTGIY
jgi:hypothetical protein